MTFHQMKICLNCSPKCQFTEGKIHRIGDRSSPIRWTQIRWKN